MSISAQQVSELRRRTNAGMMDCKKALVEAQGDMDQAIDLLKKWGISKAAKKGDRGASEGVMVPVISSDGFNATLVEVNCETDFVSNTQDYRDFAQKIAQMVFDSGINSAQEVTEDIKHALAEGISKFGENIILGNIQKISGTGVMGSYVHTNFKNATIVAVEGAGDLNQEVIVTMAKDLAVHISANSVTAVRESDLDQAVLKSQKEEILQEVLEQGKPPEIAQKIVDGRINKILKEELLLQQPFLKDDSITIQQLLEKISKQTSTEITVKGFIKNIIGE